MPKEIHDQLARMARRRGLKGDRFNAYVYGTLNKIEKNQTSTKNIKKAARRRLLTHGRT